MGVLQWISLLGGIFAIQDVLRDSERTRTILLWGVLAIGLVDLVLWSRELWVAHADWWVVRAPDLPLYPFRIRLFGSHGSTQAASWLGALILLAGVWAMPRLSGAWRWFGGGFLLWCSLLMGFCDSRLGMAGLLAAILIAGGKGRAGAWLAVASILPNAIWWIRDHLHPSQVAMGGGESQGGRQLLLALAVWGTVLVVRKWPKIAPANGCWRWVAGGAAVLLTSCPLWLPLVAPSGGNWSTGRIEFWRIALADWRESPMLGSGPWTYSRAYAQQHDWLLGFLPMHPHNGLLEVLIAGGWVMLAGLLWAGWRVSRGPGAGWLSRDAIGLLVVHLVVSMAFDSPLSSPQIQLLVMVVVGWSMALSPAAKSLELPRTAGLAPLLLLVPVGYVVEGLAGKAALQRAGETIHAGGPWNQGAREILDAFPVRDADLQWTRNALMARTALNVDRRDSLEVLAPLWETQALLEPGFLPNRIHRDFVRVRLGRGASAMLSLREKLDTLGRSGWEGFVMGPVAAAWRAKYPTDDPAFWMQRLRSCRQVACGDSLRWIVHWLEIRSASGSIAEARWRSLAKLPVKGLSSPRRQEGYLYGSEGSGWLLIPPLESALLNSFL